MTGSAVIVAVCAVTVLAWWLLSSRTTISTYSVGGEDRGDPARRRRRGRRDRRRREGPAVEVRRTDRYAFGRRAIGTREAAGGTLTIGSRCPKTVFDVCSASYRVTVPDNVRVTVRTTSGDVRLTGYRGSAQVDTASGDVAVGALRLRAAGAVAGRGRVRQRLVRGRAAGAALAHRRRARVVPPGRYRLDAQSDVGATNVRGVVAAEDAPFQIQALSSTGDVTVETSG